MTRPPSALTALALLLTLWTSGRILWELAQRPAMPTRPTRHIGGALIAHASGPGLDVLAAEEPQFRPSLHEENGSPAYPPSRLYPKPVLEPGPTIGHDGDVGRAGRDVGALSPGSDGQLFHFKNPANRKRSAIMASAWIFGQVDAAGRTLAPAGQLGGSQAGARVRMGLVDVGPALSLGGSFRFSSALSAPLAQEAAIGLSLRHSGPLTGELIVERRISLSRGARNAAAIVGVVGVDPVDLLEEISFAGYAQAGVVGLRAFDGFADGAARLERQVGQVAGADVALTMNGRFAVQPGLSRIDIAPGVALPFRLSAGNARLSLEWRKRVSGNARPASGPAITLGADF